MTGVETIAGFALDLADRRREQGRVNFHLCSAGATNDVMVGHAGQLIRQVTIAPVCHQHDIIPGQKFQGAVDGGLGHAGRLDALKDLRRGEMPAVVQGLQDREPLGGDAKAARTQFFGQVLGAAHEVSLLQIFAIRILCNNGDLSTPHSPYFLRRSGEIKSRPTVPIPVELC